MTLVEESTLLVIDIVCGFSFNKVILAEFPIILSDEVVP